LDAQGKRSGKTGGKPQLPVTVQVQSGKRGIVSWTLKALRVLNFDIPGFVVRKLAAKVDESRAYNDQPGCYAVGLDGGMTRSTIPAGSEPVLLLVHGTGSATLNAFGDLIPNDESSGFQRATWHSIHKAFNGRVFAFEHPTLTVPVAQNALDILKALPVSNCPPLVLLSHSRGGLICDLLASVQHASQINDGYLRALQERNRHERRDDAKEVASLSELYRLAEERGESRLPRVLRHVRVGCPAVGTSLAGPNTNIYLTVLAQLTKALPLANGLLEIAACVVKEGLEPGALPGIESMKPDSTLVTLLDSLKHPSGELVVISGDSSGAVDKILWPIFLGPHDCVVDTPSMRDGYQYARVDERPVVGDGVNHINYFSRRDVHEQLLIALRPTEMVLTSSRARLSHRGRLPVASEDQALDRPCIFFLPGFLGSELSVKRGNSSDDIWLDLVQLFLLGRGLELGLDNSAVLTTGVLDRVYEDFVEHAKTRAHVIPFAFDWRKEIEAPVAELENRIARRLERSAMPVTLATHSMGGLVARAWRQNHKDTWASVVARGGYMVQGGTPNLGTWQVPLIFSGKHKLLRRLERFDLHNSMDDWQGMIAQFPGPAQMAVYDDDLLIGGEPKLVNLKGWRELGAGANLPEKNTLKLARESAAKRAKDGFESDANIIYVAGCSEKTPALEKAGDSFKITNSSEGDGLALWKSAGKQPDYYINAEHGNIYNKADNFDALLDIALTGKTSALPTSPPSLTKRGTALASQTRIREALQLGDTPGLWSPSDQLLYAATHGGRTSAGATSRQSLAPLEVEVVHGNLMFCNSPVLVGHYQGDRIVRAEATLDGHLGGVLTQRWRLGPEFYVSEPGTSQIVVGQHSSRTKGPTGAIVVGLGRMGELTSGALTRTVMHGVLRYLQASLEAGLPCQEQTITTLLVGSGDEDLALREVIESILNGVQLANDVLQSRDEAPLARVAKLQFIEWHFDVALETRKMLESIAPGMERIRVCNGLCTIEGGQRRLYREQNDLWWTSLLISLHEARGDDDALHNSLVFSTGGGRAMALSEEVRICFDEIDRRLKAVFGSDTTASADSQRTLFEQLVPSGFKDYASQKRNLLITLDADVAFIPWEMLVDRNSLHGDPLSIEAGMLRRVKRDPDNHRAFKPLSDSHKALIVGNPPATSAGYDHLQGAVEEAKSIADRLASAPRWEFEARIYEKGASGERAEREIMAEVMNGDYEILHFAAHGNYVKGDTRQSGVVIGELEPNSKHQSQTDRDANALFFETRHVEQVRRMPSLVFLNCCHAGTISRGDGNHRLSASLAVKFMKEGAQAVVAASWAIDDNDALLFAQTFYDIMLQGRTFGEAVKEARRSIYRPGSNTWAAFQCYGDPGFSLSSRNPSTRASAVVYHHAEETAAD